MLDPIIKRLLEAYIKDIENNKFESIYKALREHSRMEDLRVSLLTRDLSEALLSCNIDPLRHMPEVPYCYLCASELYRKLELPNNIQIVRANAFAKNDNLGLLKIPHSCMEIEGFAFSHCPSLSKIVIANSKLHISDVAFYDCTEIKEIFFAGSRKEWSDQYHLVAELNGPGTIVHCFDGKIEL